MILKTGKNWLISHLSTYKGQAQLGLDGTPESEEDTGLLNPVSETLKDVDAVVGDKQINYVYNLTQTEGNGKIYREFGIYLTNPSSTLLRMTFAGFEKTSSIELNFNVAVRIR